MRLMATYDLGNKVWLIRQTKPKIWTPCTFCGGSKEYIDYYVKDGTKVIGKDGTAQRCPQCNGHGGINIYLEKGWHVQGELTVGQVTMMKSGSEQEERYMCHETGIGSGSFYYVKDLYPTQEEAQSECDKRNEKAVL